MCEIILTYIKVFSFFGITVHKNFVYTQVLITISNQNRIRQIVQVISTTIYLNNCFFFYLID